MEPTGRLVLLHGHGDEPKRFAPIADVLAGALGLAPWCPRGPIDVVGPDGGPGGAAWWADGDEAPSPQTLAALRDGLGADPRTETGPAGTVWREQRGPLVIAGFSQGGATALALAAALEASDEPDGDDPDGDRPDRDEPSGGRGAGDRADRRLVVVAGFLAALRANAPANAAVLVVHGADDDVVDPFHGAQVARRCRRNGAEVHEADHDGGHVWDATVTDIVLRWLA